MSQIAFFTRDGDMRGRRSRISRPERERALIRATNLKSNLNPPQITQRHGFAIDDRKRTVAQLSFFAIARCSLRCGNVLAAQALRSALSPLLA